MKNMRNATRILLTATGLLAAGNSARAQAQATTAPAGQAYTIINNVSASSINPVTYQWYRDNNLIPGATGASYTVPAAFAYGDNVQFYRMARAQECAGEAEKKSNVVTVTFIGYVMAAECALVVSGVCWANANVDNLQTFATRPDVYTKFYQWNRLTAYSATEPLTPAWNATADESETWTVNPCPTGWRLPTRTECQQLNDLGNSWAEKNARGNQVAGRFYGYNHATCTLPGNVQGCMFFPASGYRDYPSGELHAAGDGGGTWNSNAQANNNDGYFIYFTGMYSNPAYVGNKKYGYNIRCVK